MHLEAVGFNATAAAATGSAAAAVAGDSLIVKNARTGTAVYLLAWLADQQTAGFQQLTFQDGHDTTRGMRFRVPGGQVYNLLPLGTKQPLFPQTTLSVLIAATAVAGDIEHGCFLIYYEDLPGISGHFALWADIRDRIEDFCTVDATLATGTAGGWSGAEALNAESDLLLPNRSYAVLGAAFDDECAALGVRSPDFGNARIAIPGQAPEPEQAISFFPRLSEATGLPCVPILNSGNRANILVDALQDENGVDVDYSLILGLLPFGM